MRKIANLIWKDGSLLVRDEGAVVPVVVRDGSLLRKQAIRGDGIPIVQPIEIFEETAEAAPDHSSLEWLPCEAKTGGKSPILVWKLPGKRKRRVFDRLRIDLKIFAHAEIKSQPRISLKCVVKIETEIRHVERTPWLAGALEEVVVDAESKVRQVREAIRSTKCSELRLSIRIEATECQVSYMRVGDFCAKLERVLSMQVVCMIR